MRTYTNHLIVGLTLVAYLGLTNIASGQDPLDNAVSSFQNWDQFSADWTTGNSKDYFEGEAVPHILSFNAPLAGPYFVDFCLESFLNPEWGYLGFAPYDTDVTTITLDSDGVAVNITNTLGAFDGTNVTMTSVLGDTLGHAFSGSSACDAADHSVTVIFTVPTPNTDSYIYFGGVLSKPGDTSDNGTPITAGTSASNINGVIKTGQWSGGVKTVQVTAPDVLLPVELVSFSARLEGTAVVLNWKTASEDNNAGFSVEHSVSGAPFTEIGFVEGYGTTLDARAYTFRVVDIEAGRHQFRLKQIDFDGAFEYSQIVEVASEIPGTHLLSEAYPNPFNPTTSFSLAVGIDQDVQIRLYDITGRMVQTIFDGGMKANETRLFSVKATNLPSGTYTYVVAGANFRDSRSIVLLK